MDIDTIGMVLVSIIGILSLLLMSFLALYTIGITKGW